MERYYRKSVLEAVCADESTSLNAGGLAVNNSQLAVDEDVLHLTLDLKALVGSVVDILMLTLFKDDLDYVQINKILSENAAKLFKLYPKKGALMVGSDADITVYDPSVQWTISAATQHQNVDHTPYEGFEVQGQMKYVFVNGQLAVVDGEPTGVQAGTFVRADCF